MMRALPEVGMAVLVAALAMLAAQRARGTPIPYMAVPVPPRASFSPEPPTMTVLQRERTTLIQRNPFRVNRLPGIIRNGQPLDVSAIASSVPVVPQRVELVVHAIVGGPPWSALVAGLPSAPEPRVVREGEAFESVRIVHISADTVAALVRDTLRRFVVARGQR